MATNAEIITAFLATDESKWEVVDSKRIRPDDKRTPMLVTLQLGAPDPTAGDPPEGVSLYWFGELLGTAVSGAAYTNLKAKFDAIQGASDGKHDALLDRYRTQALLELQRLAG